MVYNFIMATMSERRRVRPLGVQMEELVSQVEKNPSLHTDRFQGFEGRARLEVMWGEVANVLAELGPARSAQQWKDTWRDLRQRSLTHLKERNEAMKNKGSHQLCYQVGTYCPPALNSLEERVLWIIGQTDGLSSGTPGGICESIPPGDRIENGIETSIPAPPTPLRHAHERLSSETASNNEIGQKTEYLEIKAEPAELDDDPYTPNLQPPYARKRRWMESSYPEPTSSNEIAAAQALKHAQEARAETEKMFQLNYHYQKNIYELKIHKEQLKIKLLKLEIESKAASLERNS